ncbi:MAG: ABC transporter, partial [Gemmatimonadaceae bacterium]
GIALENQFLLDMGAVMTNTGGAVDCGYQTVQPSSLRPHQITTGLTNLTMACSSTLVPGGTDFPLYFDQSNSVVLSAVATIDVTPILKPRPTAVPAYLRAVPAGLNIRSSTGR